MLEASNYIKCRSLSPKAVLLCCTHTYNCPRGVFMLGASNDQLTQLNWRIGSKEEHVGQFISMWRETPLIGEIPRRIGSFLKFRTHYSVAYRTVHAFTRKCVCDWCKRCRWSYSPADSSRSVDLKFVPRLSNMCKDIFPAVWASGRGSCDAFGGKARLQWVMLSIRQLGRSYWTNWYWRF